MKSLNEDLLVSLVDTFLEPFGLDSDFSSDFSYDYEDDTVYFTIMVSERADRLFKQYISNEFHFDPPSIFMISLLHEVGHAYTLPFISKMIIESDHQAKKEIEKQLEKDNSDDTYSKYFDLRIEKVATEWAVNYYKANRKRCDDFYSNFAKTLCTEYERLGLTE